MRKYYRNGCVVQIFLERIISNLYYNLWCVSDVFEFGICCSWRSIDAVKAVVEMQRNVTVRASFLCKSSRGQLCMSDSGIVVFLRCSRWKFQLGLISIYQHRLFKHFLCYPLEQCWTFEGIWCACIFRMSKICIFTCPESILCEF